MKLNNNITWQEETEKLRMICQECGLTEEWKWSKPCYTFHGKNIVIIQGFKDYCALLFFKGHLMPDVHGMLIRTGENTRVGRQIRFTDVREIYEQEPLLKEYIREAIAVEKSGIKAEPEDKPEMDIPDELQTKLDQLPALKAAFEALTPGRQRGYIFYFSQPKQSKTRTARIEKCIPQILAGRGLNDEYKG